VNDRRFIIETGLIFIALSVLTAIAREVAPDAHQLVRFAVCAAIVTVGWLVARTIWERQNPDG
jgi:hypothetical protein